MLSLEICKEIPICHRQENTFTGMVKMGDCLYFCNPERYQILQYNDKFHQIECYETKRRYTHICYCHSEKCFFAITKENYNKIYRLNACFEEENSCYIDTGCCTLFNGIDCKEGCIYLSSGCYILTVFIRNSDQPVILLEAKHCLASVAKGSQYLMTAWASCQQSAIAFFDHCQQLQLTCCLPCQYQIQDIKCDNYHIYILVSNCHGYNFVLICHLQKHCKKNSCHQECNDIIESIALMETSLSHILNAEGEKIQKIIACSDDPEVILEVNKAVNRTITNITHLEHVLYSKLETAKCLCEKNNKKS